ncbi:MAG: hypothetical protein JWQ27_1505 [Ferruginibacter sp.]|nr:hypothetical protein [Ferruginibacter sp.]
MLLRSLFVSILVFFAAFTSPAQTFKVAWGDNTKMKFDFDDAVPLADGKFIVLKLESKGRAGLFNYSVEYRPILMLIDKNMETIVEKELQIEDGNSNIKGFEKYGKNIFFIYSAYDKGEKKTTVYAIKIDETTLRPSDKINMGSYESDSRGDQATPEYKLSSDSSKVMLFVEGPERKKDNKRFYVAVFDTDLKAIWKKDIELPIGDRYVSIYDQDVTNDGKVFVAIKHYDKEVTRQMVRENGSKVPSYIYKLLAFSPESDKEKEINFDLNNQFIQGTKLVYNKNNTITVAGLYKRKYNGNINGAFYASIDPTQLEAKNLKMVEFPTDLLRLVDKDDFGTDSEKDPGLYSNFRIRHIMARQNGSVDLISEYYRLDVITTYNPTTHSSSTTYRYYYGDIVNTNIDKEGKAVFTRVPKDQKLMNANIFCGYHPFIYNDKLVLLYNDDEDNLDRDLEKAPDDVMNFKQSVFAAATIDAKGNLSRQPIYSHRDEDYITVPRSTTRISENKFLIVSDLLKLFKKRTRFGVMEMK